MRAVRGSEYAAGTEVWIGGEDHAWDGVSIGAGGRGGGRRAVVREGAERDERLFERGRKREVQRVEWMVRHGRYRECGWGWILFYPRDD